MSKFNRHSYYRVHRKIKKYFQRKLNCATVGVKGIVVDPDNKVLLVKHTYAPGWHFPGGGVDHNETPIDAVKRELMEEVGIYTEEEPKLMGVYHHQLLRVDDFPLVYIVRRYTQKSVSSPEIEECQWYALGDIPADTTPATRRRLGELFHGNTISQKW